MNLKKLVFYALFPACLTACKSDTSYQTDGLKIDTRIEIKRDTVQLANNSCLLLKDTLFDVQGHRGCRGLYPENTIAGFIKALEMGVNTLEMDVVISRDKKVLLSHVPWMSSETCLQPDGDTISKKQEKQFNIYKMSYKEISRFDCGSKFIYRFQGQQKCKEIKPLLTSVIIKVVEYCVNHNQKIPDFNIEIKSLPEHDNIFHPKVEEYVMLVLNDLKKLRVLKNSIIQSLDKRALQATKRINSGVRISLLVENQQDLDKNIAGLGFIPNVYSCSYESVSKNTIKRAHELNIKVIPWTVNDTTEIKRLINFGADGIITDYPNLICKRIKIN